jgi:predicted nucleic acid-binding protein
MVYVLDASFCVPHIIPDEKSEFIDCFFSSIGKSDVLYVPQLWWYELGNILKKVITRKRLEYTRAAALVADLPKFGIHTDSEHGGPYTERLFRLAHDYDLTVYDAAYLELAARKGAVLGTLDGNLKTAAIRHGVETV